MLPRIGFPSASGQAMSAVGFTVQQGLVNSLGMAAIVVFGVGSRLFSLFDVPAFGIGNATSVLVGHAIGAGDASLARKTITSSLLTILLLEMPLPSVAMLAGGDLVRLWHIRLPVAYSLAWWTGFDPSSIWLTMFASNPITSAVGFVDFGKGRWKKALNRDDVRGWR